MNTYFITGIGTDVGKTIVSAIVTEALHADYWKPIQAGDLDHGDTQNLQRLISNAKTKCHPSAYALKTPMSPHAAADIDGVSIELKHIKAPKTKNDLVIEGAGGILVPINKKHTILDLIQPNYKVIVVSRHYLGSINHTLLTLNILKQNGINAALIFSGNEQKSTEAIITSMSKVPVIGRIEEEPYFDKNVILEYAEKLKAKF